MSAVRRAAGAATVALLSTGCGSSPAPGLDRAAMLDPSTCARCHADHVRDWSGSMHAYASDDPVFVAMNARGQRETNGALGSFCVRCHAPMALREGATRDGLNLAQVPSSLKGVTCFFCHTVASVDGAHDAAVTLSGDLVMRGEYADPIANDAHASAYSPLHDRDRAASASLCGACHDVVSPAGAAVERTYSEWQGSVFGRPSAGSVGATCGQCHMPESTSPIPIAQVSGAPPRFFHAHDWPAVDVASARGFPNAAGERDAVAQLLGTTLQTALCVTEDGGVRALVEDVFAGHDWPSGAVQDRRAWVEIVAYRGADVIYRSGVVADGAPVVSTPDDPDLWLMRDCMFDPGGKPVDMFWQAASTDGNALPVQVTADPTDPRFYRTHIVQRFPRAAGAVLPQMPDRVTMRVRLRPVGLDVLEDLVASGDLAPGAAATPTWDVTPLLEWTPAAATPGYVEDGLTVTCVTTSGFDVAADKTPAPSHSRCAP